ncbi:hypothetical protein QJ054_34075 [Streptomyces sp. AN-3]|uniref:hypothetical protein n=1 Tax=Streptomyces sp. AN-3 TaxID=3044177 RepID=UPI00249A6D08|nr:hypothetical protein [Streptomyces sp. AN-3]MDI3102066.1 hypothetical protein [Streptomyces sp. AN-3]
MPQWLGTLKPIAYTLALLALTHPPVLGVQAFPGRLGAAARSLGRAWVTSVAAVFPRTA